jgi:hypothetical protein
MDFKKVLLSYQLIFSVKVLQYMEIKSYTVWWNISKKLKDQDFEVLSWYLYIRKVIFRLNYLKLFKPKETYFTYSNIVGILNYIFKGILSFVKIF